jgi:hypothetical protein
MDMENGEKLIKIGKFPDVDEQEYHTTLIHGFFEPFSWKYLDMSGIDPKIVTHNIVLTENAKPIRKKTHKMNPKIALQVKAEIEKLLDTCFIRSIDYSP